jgi:thiol-disulfide isomerase/thioredoxin
MRHGSEYSATAAGSMARMRKLLLAVALLAAAASAARAQQADEKLVFPDLEFAGADGGTLKLSQLKGNVVLLNVWATWCGPCRMELPVVQHMYDRYSDRNFVVLAVNVDADRNRVTPFMKRYNISLPIYYAAPEDASQMTAMGIPSTFVLAPDRTLIDRQIGYSPQVEERWKALIEKHLKARKR